MQLLSIECFRGCLHFISHNTLCSFERYFRINTFLFLLFFKISNVHDASHLLMLPLWHYIYGTSDQESYHHWHKIVHTSELHTMKHVALTVHGVILHDTGLWKLNIHPYQFNDIIV